ncbi:hypothetical protein V8D89_009323 [Ganoderma adspersum]
MHSPLCGVPVHVEPQIVIVAMVYAIIFATTTCGLAIRSYIHIFKGLSPLASIALAVVLTWYALDTGYWVTPLAYGVHLHLRTLAMGGRAMSYASGRDDTSLAPVLLCATPGFLAISILVGEAILWWRVCAVWAGNRAVYGICAVSTFVTLVFVAVTIGRLEIMKSPPTRLAAMFFVEPDGIGTAVSVFVSGLVVCVLLDVRTRTRGPARKIAPGWREHGGNKRTGIQRLWDLARWSIVVATLLGTFWVIVAAYRHQVWMTLRNDAPTWSFWSFTLFAATASSIRLPVLVWLLPQSFKLAPSNESDVAALSNDPEGIRERLMVDDSVHEHEHPNRIGLQESGDGGASHSQPLDSQAGPILAN